MEGFRLKLWKELKQRVEKGVETASHKSQQMVEISRLNLRIRGKKEDINRLYRRLGILVYEAWNENKGERLVLSGDMKEVLQLIRQFQADITAMERELLSVRGKVDCPECGAVFDRGTEHCPVCQAPIPHAMPPSTDARNTASEPQASDASSHRRHSEPIVSQTVSSDKNEPDGERRTAVASDNPRALSEFQTVVGEAIFVCPECGNQLKELVDTCPYCGEKFL
jgi:rubrerythrin